MDFFSDLLDTAGLWPCVPGALNHARYKEAVVTIRAAGSSCTPTRIARQVESRIRYTAAKAMATFQRQPVSWCAG